MHDTQHKYKKNVQFVKIVRNAKDDNNPRCSLARSVNGKTLLIHNYNVKPGQA